MPEFKYHFLFSLSDEQLLDKAIRLSVRQAEIWEKHPDTPLLLAIKRLREFVEIVYS